jgi:hypothetical protein
VKEQNPDKVEGMQARLQQDEGHKTKQRKGCEQARQANPRERGQKLRTPTGLEAKQTLASHYIVDSLGEVQGCKTRVHQHAARA